MLAIFKNLDIYLVSLTIVHSHECFAKSTEVLLGESNNVISFTVWPNWVGRRSSETTELTFLKQ